MRKYGLHGQPKCDSQEWEVPTKSIISKLLVNRDYKTWYLVFKPRHRPISLGHISKLSNLHINEN